jgi:hypothetical protein
LFDGFNDATPTGKNEFAETSCLTDFAGSRGEPAFFGLVDYFPEMAVSTGDKESSVFGCLNAFYAHCRDRDGHVGVVEGECTICGGRVDSEEEKG